MTLRLYNTMTRSKETFAPLTPDRVGMYVCGPTVYDDAHIGNARPVVVFDVLYRLLRLSYGDVTYLRNITDVDDKINARAAESGESIQAITERTTRRFHEDMAALGALPPSLEPRATRHIPEMIALTERLLASGNAYQADGHVLFHVPSMADYGRLSGRNREEMIAGARVEVASYKKDPADFVLWKPSVDPEPGWESPWGVGRPGWHLECSAMSSKYLGPSFDIHGGGQDLIFPHHENEIAQSCCGNPGSSFARYWVHNGYLMVEGEKMSKSLGNFYTVRELRGDFPGEAIRLVLLQTHYRQPLDFTKDGIARAKASLDRFYGALRGLDLTGDAEPPTEIIDALNDDLNTPQALHLLHQLLGETNKAEGKKKQACAARLRAAAGLLGLLGTDPEVWFRGPGSEPEGDLDEAAIEKLISERLTARESRDFATADRIRDALKEQGILLEDGAGGTQWKRG